MPDLFDLEWTQIFVPDTPLLEIFVRGSLTYLVILALLRFVLKRQLAGRAVTDLLVLVLIADAAQNGMADGYTSVSDGLVLVAVIVWWSWFLDWLGFHVPAARRVLTHRPLPLVVDGVLQLDNMRRELVTREELMSELRKQGIDDVSKVHLAYMEPDGQLSVLERDGHRRRSPANMPGSTTVI